MYFVLILTLFTSFCCGANIFCIFPTGSYSHQQPLLALSHALAVEGHNLTVITANPSKDPVKNHLDIDVSFLYRTIADMKKHTGLNLQGRIGFYEKIMSVPGLFEMIMTDAFKSSKIQELKREIKETKFDLIIYEAHFTLSLLGFSHLLNYPPTIAVQTLHPFTVVDVETGNPVIPSYIPVIFLPFSDHMDLYERAINLYGHLLYYFVTEYYIKPIQDKIMKKEFTGIKHSLKEIESNKSLLLVNADLASGYPKPVQPNTIYVGPMHLRKETPPLPQDIQKWMDQAVDGVIYFSLGSNMKSTSVPELKRQAFIKAFSKFPKLRVLWKWESDNNLLGHPDNVMVKKWLPQQSILGHKNCRLFISQVGVQSVQEAIYYGVPVLAVPMFGDQDYNAKRLETAGAGIILEFQDITDELVLGKLTEILTNPRYKENMNRLSLISRDKPMPPVETAVWWVEYVLRFNGAPHLRPASVDLSWYKYYMLDIFGIILVILLLILYFICIIFSKIKSLLRKKSNKLKVN